MDQNQNINRVAGDNYIQDTRSMVLRRYFLVSFLLNFNKMGRKTSQEEPLIPGMRKAMRDLRVNWEKTY
jgi:hypothetical protein